MVRKGIRGIGMRLTFGTIGIAMAITISAAAQTTPAPTPPSPQQQARDTLEFNKTHYTKHEYRVAMRDGVKLYTVVVPDVADAV
jgi:predicted acyl esterase